MRFMNELEEPESAELEPESVVAEDVLLLLDPESPPVNMLTSSLTTPLTIE